MENLAAMTGGLLASAKSDDNGDGHGGPDGIVGVIERDELERLTSRLVESRAKERGGMSGLDAKRQDQIIAGAVLAREIFHLLDLKRIHVCRAALREGILVDYRHFHGGFDTIATHRRMYRREVRAVRTDPALGIHSFRDAQGFRVGPENRRIRARRSGAAMYHYGWVRAAEAVKAKYEAHAAIFQWSDETKRERMAAPTADRVPFMRHFPGPHPTVVRDWIAAHPEEARGVFAPWRFKTGDVRYYLSGAIEAVTGWRPFEFRNYTTV
jgi:hypothetical protein